MSEFEDFLKLVAEGKKDYKENDPVGKKLEEVKLNIKSDLGSLFGHLSEAKINDPINKKIETVKENVKSDLGSLFAQLSEIATKVEPLEGRFDEIIIEVAEQIEEVAQIIEEVPVPEIKPASQQYSPAEIEKIHTGKSFQQPDPDLVTPQMDDIRKKLKFMEQAIGKIAALGPGSGEVNLRWLDDVYRPSIMDGRYLRYNDTLKKFEFAEVNPHDIVYTTTLVTNNTYTVSSADYYIGVNYAGPVTITLPTELLSSGRMIIIKDESGAAETNPITVLGTVDNDAGGFIIQINNGAIQLIYRSGWRIV
jgi:archaellum component FlaC